MANSFTLQSKTPMVEASLSRQSIRLREASSTKVRQPQSSSLVPGGREAGGRGDCGCVPPLILSANHGLVTTPRTTTLARSIFLQLGGLMPALFLQNLLLLQSNDIQSNPEQSHHVKLSIRSHTVPILQVLNTPQYQMHRGSAIFIASPSTSKASFCLGRREAQCACRLWSSRPITELMTTSRATTLACQQFLQREVFRQHAFHLLYLLLLQSNNKEINHKFNYHIKLTNRRHTALILQVLDAALYQMHRGFGNLRIFLAQQQYIPCHHTHTIACTRSLEAACGKCLPRPRTSGRMDKRASSSSSSMFSQLLIFFFSPLLALL